VAAQEHAAPFGAGGTRGGIIGLLVSIGAVGRRTAACRAKVALAALLCCCPALLLVVWYQLVHGGSVQPAGQALACHDEVANPLPHAWAAWVDVRWRTVAFAKVTMALSQGALLFLSCGSRRVIPYLWYQLVHGGSTYGGSPCRCQGRAGRSHAATCRRCCCRVVSIRCTVVPVQPGIGGLSLTRLCSPPSLGSMWVDVRWQPCCCQGRDKRLRRAVCLPCGSLVVVPLV
jgi:hypothetical protein